MGYDAIELTKYRIELNNHMDKIPNSYIKLWLTDNNGQICQMGNTKDIIGKCTIGDKTEVGNGGNYVHLFRRKDLTCVCVYTTIRPKWKKRGESATWHSEFGRYYRQIDFFHNKRKYEKRITQIRNDKIESIRQAPQRKILIVNLQVTPDKNPINGNLTKQLISHMAFSNLKNLWPK